MTSLQVLRNLSLRGGACRAALLTRRRTPLGPYTSPTELTPSTVDLITDVFSTWLLASKDTHRLQGGFRLLGVEMS